MQFRKDINGLRTIAVIAVVLYHFIPSLLPGGFAGVDVFFVISGFLMTGIIFRGIEQEKFFLIHFYAARAHRIIPALALLCITLLILGWVFLPPIEYKTLGKHVASSVGFLSNFIYWTESGYFATASHDKWLLHTWSLSTEWQFYILYPALLVVMRKFISLAALKLVVLVSTFIGFIFCAIATYKWGDFSYYLLPTRAWEMMLGGVAYLYPFAMNKKKKLILERTGIVFILTSYVFISKENPWPGYLALFPVFGTFFIIQAQRHDSFITCNIFSQKIGKWSYSIYLWHWPIVVAIYYFSLNEVYAYLGMGLSVLLGFLSYHYIESYKFKNNIYHLFGFLRSPPLYMMIIVGGVSSIVFLESGFIKQAPAQYQYLISNLKPSPFRNTCHINKYQEPDLACEYFGDEVSWVTFGDSHSTEIAYALAKKLATDGVGLKHFSFSGCKPSYQELDDFSKCSKWYNETAKYILNNNGLKNVVFNHRFTNGLLGGGAYKYPELEPVIISNEVIRTMERMDELILLLSEKKDNVYIFYPIPELQRDISQLIGKALITEGSLLDIEGTKLDWYNERNDYIINHFDNSNYPSNVFLLKPQSVFCDAENCYAVKEGEPLYFDNDHPSLIGAAKLVDLIEFN